MPTVVQLRDELKRLGLKTSGRKADLLARLAESRNVAEADVGPARGPTGFASPRAGLLFAAVAVAAAWHGGSPASLRPSPAPVQVLLERPSHTIPAATWHRGAQGAVPAAASGPLTPDQVQQYFEDGFLILPRFFEARLPGLQNDVEALIDSLARRLLAAGLIASLHEGLGWTSRLLAITREYPNAPMAFIKQGILPENFQALFADERMLDAAAQLGVGPDVAVNAAWNLRAKMPSHDQTVVPWHQDNSYWEPRIWDEHVVTVWVALVDSHVENGCMQYVRGGHRSGRTARHVIGRSTRTWYTETDLTTVGEDLFGDPRCGLDAAVGGCEGRVVTAEVPAGTAILFPGTMPHRSLTSTSSEIRWSADYRLHRAAAKRPGFKRREDPNGDDPNGDDPNGRDPNGKDPNRDLDWFYGLKDSLLLRPGPPDWSAWAKTERTAAQDEGMGVDGVDGLAADARERAALEDAVIVGPWMDLWNITTHVQGGSNPHVDRYVHGTSPAQRNVSRYIDAGNW
jgi:hypothetical protein